MQGCIRVNAVGDIMFGDFPLTMGLGVRSKIEYNNADLFANVHHILQDCDICFGNLESVISDHGKIERNLISCQMRGKPTSAKMLANAGFTVMSVANNHAMQHGKEAFIDTCNLISKEGISPLGLLDKCNNSVPVTKVINGLKVTMLGYSLRPEKYNQAVLYSQPAISQIIDDIKKYKAESDVIILSIHWGDEFIKMPSQEQIKAAHEFVDAGVSLVIGHHSHILQGIENYQNAVIAYSLGNFVFDFWQDKYKRTCILKCELTKSGVNKYQIIPLCISNNYSLSEPNAQLRENILNNMFKLSSKPYTRYVKSIWYGLIYKVKVKILLLINKLENRVYFIINLPNYQPWVIRQSITRFIFKR